LTLSGTGKSVLLREIIKKLRQKFVKTPDAVAITASTGKATFIHQLLIFYNKANQVSLLATLAVLQSTPSLALDLELILRRFWWSGSGKIRSLPLGGTVRES